MSDSVKPILMTPDEWRRLHTKEFQDHIYSRVWGNITKWFGGGSVLALLAFGGYLYGPVRSQLENLIDTKVTAEGARVRTELSGRITGEINTQLRREAQEIAKTEAAAQIRLGLNTPDSEMRGQLVATLRTILRDGGLVRSILVAEESNAFLTGPFDERAAHFRLLFTIDPIAARDALRAALQGRMTLGPGAQPMDEALIAAIETITPRSGTPGAKPLVQIGASLDLATLVVSVIELARVPENPASARLVEAGGRWLGSLGPARQVSEWLEMRAVRSRTAAGRSSLAWELLLHDMRPEALESLGGLFSRAPPAEIDGALRQLARTTWPRLDPGPAEQLLRVIEAHAPDVVFGHAGLTPALLEARWAMVQAAARSPQAVRFAWTLYGPALRTASVADWRPSVEAYARALERSPPPVVEAAGVTLAGLSLGVFNDANRHWPGILARILAAVPDDRAEEFVTLLLPPPPEGAQAEIIARYDRRLAALALGYIRDGMAVEVPSAITGAILAALAASPRLDASIPLGVALQRVASIADPVVCAAAAERLVTKQPWPATVLLGCAGRTQDDLRPLTARLAALEPTNRAALLRLWAFGSSRLSELSWPQANDDRATARIAVAALRAHGGSRPSPAMLGFLQMARAMAPAQIDLALEQQGFLHLYPAPTDAPVGALPPWTVPGWWENAVRLDPGVETLRAPKDQPWRLRLACEAERSTLVRVEGAGRGGSLLIVGQEAEARLITDFSRRIPVADARCVGERLLRLTVSEGATLRVLRSVPAPVGRGAPTFDARASVPPLEPDRPLSLQLGAQQDAFFPLALAADRRYEIVTRDLVANTDTLLVLLGRDGEELARDDDGSDEEFASRIVVEDLPAGAVAAIRATTFDGRGGRFEVLLRDLGPVVPPRTIVPGEEVALELDAGGRAAIRMELRGGRRYAVTTADLAAQVDTTLEILGPAGEALGENDDSGDTLASRLAFMAPSDGAYRMIVRNIGAAGRFMLLLREE